MPIAEAPREAVNALLVGETADALFGVDGAFNAALAEVAETLIASKLETLDAETVLRLYAEHVGDDVLREKLGRWRRHRPGRACGTVSQLVRNRCRCVAVPSLSFR